MLQLNSLKIKRFLFIVLALICLSPLISSPLALLSGIIFSVIWGNPFERYTHRYIHLLLQVSIVGLGFGLNITEALAAGRSGFLLTVCSIFSILILGYLLGKLLRIGRPLSYLISVGTAICGGSAIAAVSPILKPETKDISLAIAIIFTLNSIALFVFPAIGHWLNLSQAQFGLWAAIGIHDTSSVVGAANKYGNEALKIATTVKLARALWIIPVSLLTGFLFKREGTKIKIPWFIAFFILAILLNSFIPALGSVKGPILSLSKAGLNLTLLLIGSTLTVKALKAISWRPLALAILLWIMISLGGLAYIMYI